MVTQHLAPLDTGLMAFLVLWRTHSLGWPKQARMHTPKGYVELKEKKPGPTPPCVYSAAQVTRMYNGASHSSLL